MDLDFWHERWEKREIAFHGKEAHPLLVEFFSGLQLPKASRIFVPLCGKTLDIHWLLEHGYSVVACELSETAVKELFTELNISPRVEKTGDHLRYSAENIEVFIGDFFMLQREQLGTVDAVYDRAALVALPEEMRARYAKHLAEITTRAPQLLISFDYEQSRMPGPPFSVSQAEIRRLYASYELRLLADTNLRGGLRGRIPSREQVWLLRTPPK